MLQHADVLGIKIDNLLIETVDLLYTANYASQGKKLPYLEQAARRLDLAKFFLEVLWEIKGLDGAKYVALSERLFEIGKMLGGWIRQAGKKETPTSK